MNYPLKEDEFNHKKELLAAFGIKKKDAVGKSYQTLKSLIEKGLINRKVSLKKEQESRGEKYKIAFKTEFELQEYILPLRKGGDLIKESSNPSQEYKEERIALARDRLDKFFENINKVCDGDIKRFHVLHGGYDQIQLK